MDLFPIMLKLEGRKCVVIGAGDVATSKIDALLSGGAAVHVVAPDATDSVQRHANEDRLHWIKREFRPEDLEDAFIVVAATDSNSVNEDIYRTCRERGVLCNVVDDPPHCDFYYPAVVRRGHLQIAISTSGKSPALARRLRVELEQQFGPEYAEWLEHIGSERREIMSRKLPADEQRRLLEQIASGEAYDEFVRRGSAKKL
jgi:precorrin-2 dehydrogenase / sirohydrochlorin ferrochelatase